MCHDSILMPLILPRTLISALRGRKEGYGL
nr:MAG TPA: hypothetical protein [Caudoviricetes sp.]DAU62234.1 MAG TPA: hypothetical protein [Caudoviricetes sp.]